MELQNDEIVGLKALEKTGDKIFGDKDVMEVMIKEKIYEINEKEHCLTVYLPFAKKDELNLGVTDNDLIISYRNETRRFAIPATWKKYTFSSAKMEGEYLNIYFL